jgi:hypothetical protein
MPISRMFRIRLGAVPPLFSVSGLGEREAAALLRGNRRVKFAYLLRFCAIRHRQSPGQEAGLKNVPEATGVTFRSLNFHSLSV